MVTNALIQVGLLSVLVTVVSVPLRLYLARVFAGEPLDDMALHHDAMTGDR
jgi:hypothetical protein